MSGIVESKKVILFENMNSLFYLKSETRRGVT